MPTYEYRCETCDERMEVFAAMSDPPPAACESCGAAGLQKVLHAPSIHYKGSGFYATDYSSKRRGAGEGSGEGSSSGEQSGGDSGGGDSSSGGDGGSKSSGANEGGSSSTNKDSGSSSSGSSSGSGSKAD